MDVSGFLALKPAPYAIFDHLETRGERPRFMVRDGAGWRAVTWRAFADEVRHAALGLAELGLGRGQRAAIFSGNRVAWLSAAYGIQSAGAAMVPVYPASTAEQLSYIVNHGSIGILFVGGAALLDRVIAARESLSQVQHFVIFDEGPEGGAAGEVARAREALGAERVLGWEALVAAGRERDRDGVFEALLGAVTVEDVGLVLYTSGTSGPPKAVPLTYRNTGVNGRDWLVNNASLVEDGDHDLLWLPMSHIFGFGEAGLGNVLGFTSWLCDPKEVLGLLPEVRPQVFMSVPSVWDKLATLAGGSAERLRELVGGRLRFCLSGGAGLHRDVKERFLEAGLLIIEGYGLTESSPTLTMNRPDKFRFDSVGLPFPSVEVRLAEDGEIQARGESVFSGYLNDAAATAGAFTEDGWLRTGDLGRFTEDGFLQIIGRKKEILVTAGGKNVPPANIEQRFTGEPAVAHVMVWGDGKKYLVAGIWPEPGYVAEHVAALGTEAGRAAVRAELEWVVARVNSELPSYETLKRFEVFFDEPLTVDGGLLTSTLKLRRNEIGKAFGARLDALYAEHG